MKFIQILFTTPMVHAILGDSKSQTRRTKGLELINDSPNEFIWLDGYHQDDIPRPARKYDDRFYYAFTGKHSNMVTTVTHCPYGKVGDILWVRESFFWEGDTKFTDISPIGRWHYKADENGFSPKWRPSIHMPKEACRLFLKVKSVRVERLQDISEDDAEKEGINIVDYNCYENYMVEKDWHYDGMNQKGFHMIENPIGSFASLWAKINGEHSWKDNPWVWVIEFERVNLTESKKQFFFK